MTYHAYVGANAEDHHPEEPDRIVGIHQRLQGVLHPSHYMPHLTKLIRLSRVLDAGLLSRMDRIAVREAVKAEATLVHSAELWHKVNSFASMLTLFLC